MRSTAAMPPMPVVTVTAPYAAIEIMMYIATLPLPADSSDRMIMSRYKNHREPRRRGFDDDNFSPRDRDRNQDRGTYPPHRHRVRPRAMSVTVSWFNAEKGFGFVQSSDGSDAFLHIRALEASGTSLLLRAPP